MRGLILAAVALSACPRRGWRRVVGPGLLTLLSATSACPNNQPPPIGDPDGSVSQFTDDAYAPPVFVDSGADAGTTEQLDFAGSCTPGLVPIWHFFDFQTHTPGDSSLHFSAQSADTAGALSSAPSVALATVTGPDITSWTGVDVDPKLQSIKEQSRAYLRVTIVATPSTTDGAAPVLTHYRQSFDCIVGQ